MADVVHKSSHPSLPPAAPEQVVQYLLAKNFHLTALELLVEAQQAGHGDDVRDLEAFFSDRDRFPPDELARYQADNAFDLQAAGKERESRLQLAEYELRLAKEDLAEMARKLAQAQERQQQLQKVPSMATTAPAQATAAGTTAGAAPSPFFSGLPPASPSASSVAGAAQLGPPGAAPSPLEQRALNTAVFAHLLRQGLVTTAMTMEEEYGGSLREAPVTHGSLSSDAENPWELWSWYQAAARSAAAGEATTTAGSDAAVAAAGDAAAAATPAGPGAPSTAVAEAALAAVAAAAVDPEDIIQQFDLGGGDSSRDGSEDAGAADGGASAAAEADGLESVDAAALRAQLRAAREELAATRARARGAVVAATAAAEAAAAAAAAASATAAATEAAQRQLQQQQQQQQQQLLKSAPLSRQSPVQHSLSYVSGDVNVMELLDLGPPATGSGTHLFLKGVDAAAAAAEEPPAAPSTAAGVQPSPARLGSGVVGQNEAAAEAPGDAAAAALLTSSSSKPDGSKEPPWRRIDPGYHASLEVMLSGLCDALPRLVPNLNLKSRVEVLPLIVATAKTTTDWEVRRQLLAAVFNLAPAPDYQQRQAIIDACLEMCQAFGASWAATELLQLCCRQANSPSSERRTLVAETLGEAVGTVDPGTQAHVLLTQLSQLAKDRMELVREAACHSLARLVPRLPFTRSYYTTLEGLLLPLATDASEAVHIAALSYLVPALLTWQPQDTDSMLVSSCLARVLSEISQQVRIIEQYQQAFFNHQHQHQQQQQQQQQHVQQGKGDTAAGGFSGAFLRYGQASSPSPPPPAPASPSPPPSLSAGASHSSEGQLGSGHTKGSSSSLSDMGAAAAGATAATATATAAAAGGQPLASGASMSAGSASGLPTSPPPPPQWVSFGRRSFPSASHLLLYQLLALYGGLTPALRHAALRSRPEWACPAGCPANAAGTTAGGSTTNGAAKPPAPCKVTSATAAGAANASGSRRHQRGGSLDGPKFTQAAAAAGAIPATAATAAAAAAVPANREQSIDLMGPTHRRTSSHPVFGGFGPLGGGAGPGPGPSPSPSGGGATGGTDGSSGGAPPGLPGRMSLQHAQLAPLYQMMLPKSSSSTALANGVIGGAGGLGPGGEAPTEQQWTRGAGGAVEPSPGDLGGARTEEGGEEGEEVLDDWERAAEDASLAAWATHGSHGSWKTLEWLMQHVVPELIRLVCCVGPMFPEAHDVRRQAAFAVAATCSAMGAPFTQAAIEPVFLVASGTGTSTTAGAAAAAATGTGGGGAASLTVAVITPDLDAPVAVRGLCASLQPRSPEVLRIARQCVLPVLLVSVLPAAGRLRPYLLQLMGSAHELRQRWLMDALPDYTTAVTFACSQRSDLLPQVLHVFEDLLSGATSAASSQAQHHNHRHGADGPGGGGGGGGGGASAGGAAAAAGERSAGAAAAPAAAGPASTHVGLCCAALARALVPVASLELASRRLLPGLMALMSYGEPELQRACVGVLAELGLRFRGDGPRVSEQVLAVYDSLLEQGGHGVQLEVLAAGTALAAAAAPTAAVSAAAAAQVEWLLTAVQVVAARLTAPTAAGAAAGGAGPGSLTPDQQRALAAQLLAALRAVAPYDLRLPRLQANLSSALDAIQRCKALLTDPQQQAALSALMKERPTGQSAAGASVSSSTPSAAAATAAAAAAAGAVGAVGVAPLRTGPASALPPMPPYSSHGAGGLAVTPTQSASGGGNPFLPPTGGTPATHGSVQGTPDGAQASGGVRSRFDAFRQRLMKRRDDVPAAAVTAAAAGAKPKESFFSDDEGE